MSACSDSKAGALLHAYELRLLSEEETERFETHLLSCEDCFTRLGQFREKAALLMEDEEAKNLLQEAFTGKAAAGKSLAEKLREHLWPRAPVFFKPLLAYIAILILIIPAAYILMTMGPKSREDYQSIYLYDYRSPGDNVFRAGAGQDGKILFRFSDAHPGESYPVIIVHEGGADIFRAEFEAAFDDYGVGSYVFPHEDMKPGKYTLTVVDTRTSPPVKKTRTFEIIGEPSPEAGIPE
jgi:hypothetical protein